LDILSFCQTFVHRLDEMEEVLSANLIWQNRLVGIGTVGRGLALQQGFSGVVLRSTGIPCDLRALLPCEVYGDLAFQLFVAQQGDCYDRYLLRMHEMRESLRLMETSICLYLEIEGEGSTTSSVLQYKNNMELMIHHFKLFSGAPALATSRQAFQTTEAPKGEFSIYVVHRAGSATPARLRIRAPGFFHLQALHSVATRHKLADLVAIIGTLDIVFGEVDR
jgi:NADH:ubiquinone oxidoreductase subunit D